MAPKSAAPWSPPVAAPAAMANPMSAQSETVSASLVDTYAATTRARHRSDRSACARYGTTPAVPADFTTLLVAYDVALRLTIGPMRAGNSTSRNEACAWKPRLSTPNATIARPIGSAAGPRPATLPIAGRKPSACRKRNHPAATARMVPRIRGVHPARRVISAVSSTWVENLMSGALQLAEL